MDSSHNLILYCCSVINFFKLEMDFIPLSVNFNLLECDNAEYCQLIRVAEAAVTVQVFNQLCRRYLLHTDMLLSQMKWKFNRWFNHGFDWVLTLIYFPPVMDLRGLNTAQRLNPFRQQCNTASRLQCTRPVRCGHHRTPIRY